MSKKEGAASRPTPLTAAEREALSLVATGTQLNPFETAWSDLVGAYALPGTNEAMEAVRHVLAQILSPLDRRGLASLRNFDGDDRALVRPAYLALVYYRFVDQIDQLIADQLRHRNPPVTFAEPLIAALAGRGFTEAEGLHYLALFYQLRRAFSFVKRSIGGNAPSIRRFRAALWNNVFTCDLRVYDRTLWSRMEDFSTLILGETGAGKGAAASAIGRSCFIPFDRPKGKFQASFTQAFTATNLSKFPATLIESELFGHRKGAFTGAIDDHKGILERCSPFGALFLDEIGDASAQTQIKLLQVLQDRTFTPVGSHETKRFHGRVIAATNRPIDELRREGHFRDDFFYRLCSDVITVPTLRQRLAEDPDELPALVNVQLERMTGEADPRDACVILETLERELPGDYPWPGNVRELEQAVRRILLTHHYQADRVGRRQGGARELAEQLAAGSLDARTLLTRYCALLYDQLGTIEAVARRTGLDRRTVKKYLAPKKGARTTA